MPRSRLVKNKPQNLKSNSLTCSVELQLLPSSHENGARQQDRAEMDAFSRAESSAILISILLVCALTVIVAWLVFTHADG